MFLILEVPWLFSMLSATLEMRPLAKLRIAILESLTNLAWVEAMAKEIAASSPISGVVVSTDPEARSCHLVTHDRLHRGNKAYSR